MFPFHRISAVAAGLTLSMIVLLLLAPPRNSAAQSNGANVQIAGHAIVAIGDDPENHKAVSQYFVREDTTGKLHELRFKDKPPQRFRSGAHVHVKGTIEGGQIVTSASSITVDGPAALQTAAVPTGPASFAQNTLVVMLNFLDLAATCTSASCEASVFAATNSTQSMYAETSSGHVSYTGTTVGPFTISVNSTDSCPSPYLPTLENWAALADQQVKASGIDPTTYTEKVYVLPNYNRCAGFRGYATIGGSPGLAWIFSCKFTDLFAHEMGHNLGMAHASTPTSEYGDDSDIMAISQIGLRDLNAPHLDQFNWIPQLNIASPSGGGSFTLVPLELASTPSLQIVKIPKTDTNETYYVSYRQPIGYDTILPKFNSGIYTNGVSIHRFAGPAAADIHTYLLQTLTDGSSFTDTVNNITITQMSHDSSGAKVTVSMGPQAMSLNPSTLSFGTQNVGTSSAAQSATLSNTGGSAITISSVGITGTNSTDFLVPANACGTSLNAGASCTIPVTFHPNAAGTRTASLAVAGGSGSQQITLTGTGVSATPSVTVTPTSLSFGNETVGSASAAQQVTLFNNGATAVSVSSVAIVGANSTDFAISGNTCTSSLGSGAGCAVSVVFKPTATGTRSGSLAIADSAGTQQVVLSGNGASSGGGGGSAQVYPSSYTFPAQLVNTASGVANLRLSNSGSTTFTISSVTSSAPFVITSSGCGTSLAAGARCVVSVAFKPATLGTFSGTLQFSDSASGSPQSIHLSGASTVVSLTPNPLVFSQQVVGTASGAKSVTLTNRGTAGVTVSKVDVVGDFAVTSNTCSTVAAGASCTIGVSFTPSAKGTRNGTLTVSDSGGGGSPQTVVLKGTGF